MPGIDRIVIFSEFAKDVKADSMEIVKLDDCYMFKFYIGENSWCTYLFASEVEMKEVRDLIDDSLNLKNL